MDVPVTYCSMMDDPKLPDVHRQYHDNVYGFPVKDDNELFGRLVLELNQAGLSWTTILNKERSFREAFSRFDVSEVAGYTDSDRTRLLGDKSIIRNRMKIDAAIHNAKAIVGLQKEFGSFAAWLDRSLGLELSEWVKLFKGVFKFTGGEITKEFLLSTGYYEGAHVPSCPAHGRIMSLSPPWTR